MWSCDALEKVAKTPNKNYCFKYNVTNIIWTNTCSIIKVSNINVEYILVCLPSIETFSKK